MPSKPIDLEERSASFAEQVRAFVRLIPRTISNIEDAKQLIRASGSVPANCIEANEALGDKDRVMRFKIARKEAKECQLWLRLLNVGDDRRLEEVRSRSRQESLELKLIFTSIIKKLE
jgi:four helix bundle protein